MSRANVEIAKRALDAFNRRDDDAFMECTTSDFELFPAMAGAVDGSSVTGREGLETLFAEVRDIWQEQHVIADEFRELGDCVLVLGRIVSRGRASGVPVATPRATISDFRDGKISRVRTYLDHGEALRARLGCPSSDQVPVSGVRPRSATHDLAPSSSRT
jgi:ketosteroid isomerase-like protein